MMETLKLSTSQAWSLLADWWDKASICECKDGCGHHAVQERHTGLCSAIGLLSFRKNITESQADAMLRSLPKRGKTYVEGVRPFLWPPDGDGAKQRAAFCREQAKLAS